MPSTPHDDPEHDEGQPPRKQPVPRRGLGDRLLALLDSFLPERLRQSSLSELTRYRVLTGFTASLLVLTLPYLGYVLLTRQPFPKILLAMTMLAGMAAVLALVRRGASPSLPATLLCTLISLGLMVSLFQSHPAGSAHPSVMLIPVFAVYLMGPRWSLLLTAISSGIHGALYPLYYTYFGTEPLPYPLSYFWMLQVFAGLVLLAAWGLSSLHSSARNRSEATLQRTLRELRESEGQLRSLIGSTDDLVGSLDTQGRVLTANEALRSFTSQHLGQELVPGQPFPGLTSREQQETWSRRLTQVLGGQRLKIEEKYHFGDTRGTLDISLNPIIASGGQILGMTLFARDITARKEAEARLREMHRTLVDVSRQAGMAEIATGVLHNVGNTLNSVNVSTGLVIDHLRRSRVSGLTKATRLLREHQGDLPTFLSRDPQGKKLGAYLLTLGDELHAERETMLQELASLQGSVDHIKSIVSMQQRHARMAGTVEQLDVPQLIDEALRLYTATYERLGITLQRDYAELPPVLADRHKLLQILVNLLTNARHALVEGGRQDKRLLIRVRPAPEPGRILIEVADNGMGIAPEHLPRLFSQGFTTRKDGHGFGLHISALAAEELKGRLTCASPGPGQGATFTLELPVTGPDVSPPPGQAVPPHDQG